MDQISHRVSLYRTLSHSGQEADFTAFACVCGGFSVSLLTWMGWCMQRCYYLCTENDKG